MIVSDVLSYKCKLCIFTHVIIIMFTFVILTFTIMKERILEFLRAENKSSAQFAEEIGVQPSGISHILSGRNNPSLDFTMKMLDKYKFLSTDWLLFGKGTMYKDSKIQDLFSEAPIEPEIKFKQTDSKEELLTERTRTIQSQKDASTLVKKASIVKIVLFFDDNTFEEYSPGSRGV